MIGKEFTLSCLRKYLSEASEKLADATASPGDDSAVEKAFAEVAKAFSEWQKEARVT